MNRKQAIFAVLIVIGLAALACNLTGTIAPTATPTAMPPTVTPPPPRTLIPTEPIMVTVVMCTPPPCIQGEVYTCPGDSCPNGCGVICATVTESPQDANMPFSLATGQGPDAFARLGDVAVTSLEWSPDGSRLAVGVSDGVSSSVILLYAATRITEAVIPAPQPVTKIAFSSEGRYLFFQTTGDPLPAEVWDLGGAEPVRLIALEGARDGAFHPAQSWLAVTIEDTLVVDDSRLNGPEGTVGSFIIWDVGVGSYQMPVVIPGMETDAFGITFSPDGSALATSRGDGSLAVVDLEGTLAQTYTPEGLIAGPVAYPILSRDWSTLAWVSRGSIIVLDRETGQERARLSHEDFVTAADLSADGAVIASAAAATITGEFVPVVIVWDARSGSPMETITGWEGFGAIQAAVSPDGAWLATGDDRGLVTLWNITP